MKNKVTEAIENLVVEDRFDYDGARKEQVNYLLDRGFNKKRTIKERLESLKAAISAIQSEFVRLENENNKK